MRDSNDIFALLCPNEGSSWGQYWGFNGVELDDCKKLAEIDIRYLLVFHAERTGAGRWY